MKALALFLTVLFAAQTVEISSLSDRTRTPNPKTCCGRPVCLCTHPKGAPCTYKKPVPHTCHLDREQEPVHDFPGVFFKQAPCHSESQKSSLPVYAKEFCLNSSPAVRHLESGDFLSIAAPRFPDFIFTPRLDQPPRFLPIPTP
jgi:hypothetical protein